MNNPDGLRHHLNVLYGEKAGASVWPRLVALLDEFRPKLRPPGGPRGSLSLSERDALLITYGDMVTAAGQPPLQTLAAFGEAHLREILSGLHLLPHYPFTSDDGFSVSDYFAVNPALGSWEDVARLGQSFDLMFDGVFNHLSAQSGWFREFLADAPAFRDFFVTIEGQPDLSAVVRPRALPLWTEFAGATGPRRVWTTFSADQVDLNFRNPEVLLATLRALLFYVEKGARYLRLDAIAYLWKTPGTPCIHLPETHRVIQFWRTVLDEVAPEVMLITETNVPHRDNLSYFGDGTNEAQLVYNFALPPLVLHALLRGDASRLTAWAQSLTLPSDQVTFFNFLASHDGIGLNPARGILPPAEIDFLVERCRAHGGFVSDKHDAGGGKSPYELNIVYFDAVNDPAADEPAEIAVRRFLVAQAILLALRGLPGIYFHSLFGSRNDRPAALASGIPRRINRGKFRRSDLEAALGQSDSRPAAVFAACRRLLQARRACPAFHPAGAQEVLAGDARVFALWRTSPDVRRRVLCLHNVSRETVVVPATVLATGAGEVWTDLLGPGAEAGGMDRGGRGPDVVLWPYESRWLEISSRIDPISVG